MKPIVLILALTAAPAFAQTCPPFEVDQTRKAEILSQMKVAPSDRIARQLSNELWDIWMKAPDEKSQRLLDMGVAKIGFGDFLGATETLNELVAYCPNYTEGYNQRAFSFYLRQDFSPALEDLNRAIALTPDHVGALAGKALTLIGMGRVEAAQEPLRRAVRLNPWLSERAFLTEPLDVEL